MDGAHEESAGRPRLTPVALGRARSLADTEGEASFRLVRIDREHVPMHFVGPGRQRFQTDGHGAAADLRFAGIDPRALAVGHLHRAEGRFETLREGKRDLVRCGGDRSADGWACTERAWRVRARRPLAVSATRRRRRRYRVRIGTFLTSWVCSVRTICRRSAVARSSWGRCRRDRDGIAQGSRRRCRCRD